MAIKTLSSPSNKKISLRILNYGISEKILLFGLFLIFVGINAPGVSWGTPAVWNPDELVIRVDKALHGEWQFDEENFDYPSLPKYVMYGVGKVVYGLGFSTAEFIQAARLVSVILGGLIVLLVYQITKMMVDTVWASLLAALLTLSSSEIAHNAHFGHNDIYLAFFVTLTLFTLIKYKISGGKLWLYAAFFGVGLTASSKYNGASLIIVPIIIFLAGQRRRFKRNLLEISETLFIGLILSILGYAAGTPKALLWMAFYIKRVTPALLNHANYGREPGSLIGLFGQWQVFQNALGIPVFLLFLISLLWCGSKLVLFYLNRVSNTDNRLDLVAVILLTIFAFDLPILVSYNYPSRFFVPFIPLLSILSALFIADLILLAEKRGHTTLPKLILAGSFLTAMVAMLRVISVFLLFQNDARILAGKFLVTLPVGGKIEYTLYPPYIPGEHFSKIRGYPIFFKKFPDQSLPEARYYPFNEGESGIEVRKPDYLIIDSFTYDRFSDRYTCTILPAECDFFQKLQAGDTHYKLVQEFRYTVPSFLPEINLSFVNPDIQIYERDELQQ